MSVLVLVHAFASISERPLRCQRPLGNAFGVFLADGRVERRKVQARRAGLSQCSTQPGVLAWFRIPSAVRACGTRAALRHEHRMQLARPCTRARTGSLTPVPYAAKHAEATNARAERTPNRGRVATPLLHEVDKVYGTRLVHGEGWWVFPTQLVCRPGVQRLVNGAQSGVVCFAAVTPVWVLGDCGEASKTKAITPPLKNRQLRYHLQTAGTSP